jgi:glycerate-2-kinase
LISLILSDVVGDPLDVIASGPTVGDPTTYKECQEVLDRYALKDKLPASVKSHLEQGIEGKVPETPKPGEPIFSQTLSILVGTNMQALKAATNQAEKLGYTSLILSSLIEGDTTEAALH